MNKKLFDLTAFGKEHGGILHAFLQKDLPLHFSLSCKSLTDINHHISLVMSPEEKKPTECETIAIKALSI